MNTTPWTWCIVCISGMISEKSKDFSNRFGSWANEMNNSFRRLIFLPYCPFGLYGNITPFRIFVWDSLSLPAKSHLCQQASRWWISAWTVKPWFFLSTHHILLCLLFYEVTIYGDNRHPNIIADTMFSGLHTINISWPQHLGFGDHNPKQKTTLISQPWNIL